MKASPLVATVALVILGFASSLVGAHTYLSGFAVNSIQNNNCIRPLGKYSFNNPIRDVTSNGMSCGFLPEAASQSPQTCDAPAQSSITLQWNNYGNFSGDNVIDLSHKGPIMVYMAPLNSSGQGPVWFKIYEDGLDPSTQEWATHGLLRNKGRLTINLPKNIPSVKYLIRTEVIALQGASRVGGAEFYVNCAQIDYTGGSGKIMPSGVRFPGAYNATDPGILLDLYLEPTSYEIPGPRVSVT